MRHRARCAQPLGGRAPAARGEGKGEGVLHRFSRVDTAWRRQTHVPRAEALLAVSDVMARPRSTTNWNASYAISGPKPKPQQLKPGRLPGTRYGHRGDIR